MAMPSQLPSAMASKKACGKTRVAVPLQPVGVVEPGADPQDLIADLLLRLGQGEVHGAGLSGTDLVGGVIASQSVRGGNRGDGWRLA